jgi:hypothetical protein
MLGDRQIPWVHQTDPEHVSERESKICAVAAWANEQERKLLGLHCGRMLDRKRHRAWAETMI